MPDYATGSKPKKDYEPKIVRSRYIPTQADWDRREEARKLEGNCGECGLPLEGEVEAYRGEVLHRKCVWGAGNHDSFPTEESPYEAPYGDGL